MNDNIRKAITLALLAVSMLSVNSCFAGDTIPSVDCQFTNELASDGTPQNNLSQVSINDRSVHLICVSTDARKGQNITAKFFNTDKPDQKPLTKTIAVDMDASNNSPWVKDFTPSDAGATTNLEDFPTQNTMIEIYAGDNKVQTINVTVTK